MPKQRLTDRQLISGVTLTDLLHFVVTGDTSQNPAGSSYKGNVEQLFGAFSAYTCSNPLTVDVVNACTSGITINGNVVINGSATTINTEVIQSKDNNIVLNYSGTHLTAIGGGITLEDGVSDGVDSRIFTNSDGVWLFDPGLSASTGTIDTLSACTGVYTSNIYGCSPLHIEPSGLNDVYIVENGGNVGIGTTTPTEVLDVSGNTKISEDLFVGDTVYVGNITGTPTTNASLYIRQPSITGSTESPIIDIQVEDANSYFRLNNNTNTDGVFSPAIITRQADTSDRIALFIDTIIDPTYDTSGAPDVLRFRARQDSGLIQNRDLYAWYNYTTRLMDMDKDGNLDIIQGGLRIGTLGTGTSINNLGIDSSGNVVTGTTGSVSDIFVSGGTYSAGTATFTNTSGGTFDVTGFTSFDTYVIAGTYIDSTDTISLLRNDGNFVYITGITDTFTTGFTYSNNNFTISQNQGQPDLVTNISVMTGLTINGDLEVYGQSTISGSGQNILTIIGSGDTNPLFTIQGSSGELFSVTDSLVGSLFSVNDISGLPILEVFDDDTVHMGSYQAPSLNTTVLLNPSTGLSTVYSIPMSAYTGAWFEYTVKNTGGARAGQIMSIFSGNTVNFTETTTTDIGSTSDITFSMSADSTNTLLQVSATTSGWEVKTIVRSI